MFDRSAPPDNQASWEIREIYQGLNRVLCPPEFANQALLITFYFHQAAMRDWTLSQLRGAFVQREHIRIATSTKLVCYIGVKPRAGADLNHTRSYGFGQGRTTKAGSPLIEDSDRIAFLDVSYACIFGVDHDGNQGVSVD